MTVTAATRIHPGAGTRFFRGVMALFFLGAFAVILFIIPPIGILLALLAIAAPIYAVAKQDSCDVLTGPCPFCSRDVKVTARKTRKGGFNCKFCRHRLMLQGIEGEERFMGVA